MSDQDTDREQPEPMAAFFDARSQSYDDHMRRSVTHFHQFYAAVAAAFDPTEEAVEVLDVGCGTGLELEGILARMPNAAVTGIDLSGEMLARLREKYEGRARALRLIQASYLSADLGERQYDYVVAVMTLHHLLPETRQRLYERIRRALKPGGVYVEGDWVVPAEKERGYLAAYRASLEAGEGVEDGSHHLDVPLSLETLRGLLLGAGFCRFEPVWHEGEAGVFVAAPCWG